MKASIRTKLLLLCIFLVFFATSGISGIYYFLVRQDKQRESRQRIQIAFDVMLNDVETRLRTLTRQFQEFLTADNPLGWIAEEYAKDPSRTGSLQFAVSYLMTPAEELKKLGYVSTADRLAFYTQDQRLLLLYHQQHEQPSVGAYLISATGQETYLTLDDPSALSTMMFTDKSIPDIPLPTGFVPEYQGEMPESVTAELNKSGQEILFRVTAPVYRGEKKIGILVGERTLSQEIVEQYAMLSKAEINVFAGNQLSVGTLPAQTQLDERKIESLLPCDEVLNSEAKIAMTMAPLIVERQMYYQEGCSLTHGQEKIGVITVSLSRSIEQAQIRKTLLSVVAISSISIIVAFGLSWVFSRKTIHTVQNIVAIISAASEGDLRQVAQETVQDELGMLATHLNQMILQLRTITEQVQNSSYAMGNTADTIFQEIATLTQRMEQQSESVETTMTGVKKVNQFITTVDHDTSELLAATEQVLASIHETRTSREEVATSMHHLVENLQMILSSVEYLNDSSKSVSENSAILEDSVHETQREIQSIDHSLKDVSQNANDAQKLAEETRKAALNGQESVNASIQGMKELKDVVSETTEIIREINIWGEQVHSILDIVDDITEQTSLLALNAAIISAQAGVHGRGFGVVANEIKELANRTKNSTGEISSLIRTLQMKTEQGVKNTNEGLQKADQGMELAFAVKQALDTIIERATHSTNKATGTAEVVQQTASSSQVISASMKTVTEMVACMRATLEKQTTEVGQVIAAVENIQSMSQQINYASIEQNKAAKQIEDSMGIVTERFSKIAGQTSELNRNAQQIVEAMHTIETITANILEDMTTISSTTMNHLVKQSELLQSLVKVFKIS
ncbi:methyl-accepting chemotaxis sensory transducer [Candidatus Vecturithrix granuli]|uniref:Methyl-accepting chemotaxis sensory transducer n=1 Tax=Vecturithrix granuli TaxID=1499967 RepID=A0A0S6W999_VECG1|nr:methyl-accepting chemotaxis sensory transducer [Candidatus Vecturithrix granuli]